MVAACKGTRSVCVLLRAMLLGSPIAVAGQPPAPSDVADRFVALAARVGVAEREITTAMMRATSHPRFRL